MPTVSVIINCLNGERYLGAALDSVFAQSFPDWEIVLWDNASTDRTKEVATSYGERVRYFRSATTTDLGPARNSAFQQARGEFLAILDSDDIWHEEKLQRQVELFRSNPDLGLVFCDSTMFDSGGDRYRLFQTGTPKRGQIFGDLLAGNFIFTSTMMYRKTALDRLGYVFDERYSRVQDYELSLRVAYHYPIDYIDETLCKWRMYQDSPEWWAWKKSLVTRVVEVKQCIENLVEIYPDIPTKYAEQLKVCYVGLDYNYAVAAWEKGNRSEARSYLSGHLRNKKFAFVYLCTLLVPFELFQRLKAIYRNNITGRKRTSQFQSTDSSR